MVQFGIIASLVFTGALAIANTKSESDLRKDLRDFKEKVRTTHQDLSRKCDDLKRLTVATKDAGCANQEKQMQSTCDDVVSKYADAMRKMDGTKDKDTCLKEADEGVKNGASKINFLSYEHKTKCKDKESIQFTKVYDLETKSGGFGEKHNMMAENMSGYCVTLEAIELAKKAEDEKRKKNVKK